MEANSCEVPAFNLVVAETQLIFDLTYTHGAVFATAFRLEHVAEVATAQVSLAAESNVPAK